MLSAIRHCARRGRYGGDGRDGRLMYLLERAVGTFSNASKTHACFRAKNNVNVIVITTVAPTTHRQDILGFQRQQHGGRKVVAASDSQISRFDSQNNVTACLPNLCRSDPFRI